MNLEEKYANQYCQRCTCEKAEKGKKESDIYFREQLLKEKIARVVNENFGLQERTTRTKLLAAQNVLAKIKHTEK